MSTEPQLPSLDAVSTRVSAELDALKDHFDSLDAKAGVVLAFAGVLVGLGATAQADVAATGWFRAGVAAAAIAGLLAVVGYFPRNYPVLNVMELRSYLTFEQEQTKLELLDTQIDMVLKAATLLKRKGRLIRGCIGVLVVAVGLMVVGTLFPGGHSHARPKPGTTPTAGVATATTSAASGQPTTTTTIPAKP